MEGKGKKLWRRMKCDQLIDYNSLPAYLKDNEFILGYYRSEWPLKQLILSIFHVHNETINIWTHLIGFLLFLFLTIHAAAKIPSTIDNLRRVDFSKICEEVVNCLISLPTMADLSRLKDALSSLSTWHITQVITKCLPHHLSSTNNFNATTSDGSISVINHQSGIGSNVAMIQPITRWPFFAFLGGAMFCLLNSTFCHLLGCHSERLRYVVLRLDYAGIAVLISTSFYPTVYYSFMCHPLPLYLYLSTITSFGIITILLSLLPSFQKPSFRPFRTTLFIAMAVTGVAPIVHKVWVHGNQPVIIETTKNEVMMGIFYGLGAIVYATRIPERWWPGKFDLVGSSHQLFHMLVIAGAYTHYRAGLIYVEWRDYERC
ncbi:heptahelical transmembrane protein ADIPOR3-like [Impatiens glandulifera]|uniref:heptahelical transmembrane protein ADIPOR3-like n=1 Tax=Impatiens glandulifera TaxID=253017 RepID=UPI001FB10FD0|nr:heptahelical transmembrane protein ADIPOR3-like [Impatiens glandulifera]